GFGQRLDRLREARGYMPGQPFTVCGIADPSGRSGREMQRTQPGYQHVSREEVILEEAAQYPADPVFLSGDDGRVRNRQANRLAEERRDREPVRQPPDQRCLRCRSDETEPRIPRFEQECYYDDHKGATE